MGVIIDLFELLDAVVRVHLRRFETGVSEQLLNHSDIGPVVQ